MHASIFLFEMDNKLWKDLNLVGKVIKLKVRVKYCSHTCNCVKINLSTTSIIDISQKLKEIFQRWRVFKFRLQHIQRWALNFETICQWSLIIEDPLHYLKVEGITIFYAKIIKTEYRIAPPPPVPAPIFTKIVQCQLDRQM